MARRPATLVIVSCLLALAGCGGGSAPPPNASGARRAALPAGARPIGPGPRFRPALGSRRVPACRRRLGRRVGVHLELFARGLVVLLPAGIGTRPPRRWVGGRLAQARCYGSLVTIDPTGLVLMRPGTRASVGDLFEAWGRPLRPEGIPGFGGRVRAWVGGRRVAGDVRAIPLRPHAEIVLEVGRYVPPHRRYAFPEPF